MVGVPRSTGCQTCVSRRVKCDETRPSCLRCRKHGVDCPGYNRERKFVNEKHLIRQRGRQAVHGETLVMTVGLSRPVSPSYGSSHGTFPQWVSPSPDRAQYICTMVEQLQSSVAQYDSIGVFQWIRLDKLGRRALLDSAMCSLTMQLLGKETGRDEFLAYGMDLYIQSLHALQVALRHPNEWKTSETLCSTILLCVYEVRWHPRRFCPLPQIALRALLTNRVIRRYHVLRGLAPTW